MIQNFSGHPDEFVQCWSGSPVFPKTPIPLDGDSATIRNFGQNDTNRNRNGKSAVEAQ